MQNDVLKNDIAPWQEKGQWYHAKIDANGIINDSSDDLIKTEFQILVLASYYRIRQKLANYNVKKHYVLDVKWIPDNITLSTSGSITATDYAESDGRIGKYICPLITAGSIDCWFYIV